MSCIASVQPLMTSQGGRLKNEGEALDASTMEAQEEEEDQRCGKTASEIAGSSIRTYHATSVADSITIFKTLMSHMICQDICLSNLSYGVCLQAI